MGEQANYDLLDTDALITILVDPDRPHHSHLAAITSLSTRSEAHRTPALASALHSILRHGNQYQADVMIAVVENLISDPSLKTTQEMLDAFPAIVSSVFGGSQAFPAEFRQHFYEALLARQSDDDLNEWATRLPDLDPRAIAGAIVDRAGKSLQEALEPWTLLERLAEPGRTAALVAVVMGTTMGQGDVDSLKKAVTMLRESCDEAQLDKGLMALEERWEAAHKAGKDTLATNLETILKALDHRPRTAMEKLSGKRPWAK